MMKRSAPNRLLRLLLGTTALFAMLWVSTAILWWRARARPDLLADLDTAQRRELVAELIEQSPGVFQWAWFAPQIGYTLRPDAELQAWGSTFRSNALGYRTHAPEKDVGVFRVVFLGDSWTFGMGVDQGQSYPEAFARLANQQGAAEYADAERVEAWILALPGYNTFNFVGAFWHFLHQLQPDAVVVGISANDNHSTHAILPNGSATKAVVQPDLFGEEHPTIYGARSIDSFRYAERWRISFALLRDLETRLEQLGIPVNHLFIGRTRELPMQARAAEAGLRAPFSVVPLELTRGKWSNDSWGHGTPKANELYGAYVYANLAETLGWPALPKAPDRYRRYVPPVEPPSSSARVDQRTNAEQWWQLYSKQAARSSADLFPTSFEPGREARLQTLGDFAARTGLLGKAATVLVRRPPDAGERSTTLRIRYRTLDDAPALYPIELTVRVPGPDSGTSFDSTAQLVQQIDPDSAGAIELELPPSSYSIADVQLSASRTAGPNAERPAASLVIESITLGP